MESRLATFQTSVFPPSEAFNGGASTTLSTENRTLREETYKTSRSHFDPKKEKRKTPEQSVIDLNRTIRDLEQRLKDS